VIDTERDADTDIDGVSETVLVIDDVVDTDTDRCCDIDTVRV